MIAGSLMVSRFRYLSGKDLDPKMRVPVAFMVLVPLGFVLVGSSPPEMLFALFAVYASRARCSRSGAASRRRRPSRQAGPGAGQVIDGGARAQAALPEALGVDVYVPRATPPLPADVRRGRRAARPPSSRRAGPRSTDVAWRNGPSRRQSGRRTSTGTQLRAAVAACERCELHATRTQTVFGVGNPDARWMFIGEAPGVEEDRQGEPFVGRAGQLLNAMIRALGFAREDVFIANVLKCRPPDNRDPRPEEAASCRGYLERQVELVNPTLVIAVGRIAAQNLLATETPIAKLRGKVHSFGCAQLAARRDVSPGLPAAQPGEKRKAWQDLLFARQVFARVEREAAVPEARGS